MVSENEKIKKYMIIDFLILEGTFQIWVCKSSNIIENNGNFLGCDIKTDSLKILQ